MAGRVVVATGGFGAGVVPAGIAGARAAAVAGRAARGGRDRLVVYALPAARTVQRWARSTPERFVFTAKLHRALSRHAAPLKSLPADLREGVRLTDRGRVVVDDDLEAALCARTLAVFEPLYAAGQFGCLLLQLTPAFYPASTGSPS